MEHEESPKQAADVVEEPTFHPADDEGVVLPHPAPDVAPAAGPESVEAASPAFVYALGQIDFRFPTLGLEKEFAQVIGRSGEEGVNDRRALQSLISEDQNRYLARGLCWVFLVEGLETYILIPRDPADYRLLIEAVREYPRRDDVDLVVGTRGDLAPPEMCNGLAVPVVVFDQIYSFDRESLVAAIPVPNSIAEADEAEFHKTAGGLFDYIMQMADNAGATDEHRALNYVAVRYERIFAVVAEQQRQNASLAGIEVRQSPLSGVRRIVDVIFSFTNRETDVTEKYFLRVDVTELHPFLMTPLSTYYELQ
jgi:hypothetical protein